MFNRFNDAVLPPIINDIIGTVLDKKNPMHVRDNACGRLEQIQRACEIVIADFKKEIEKHNTQLRNKRRA